MAPVRTTRIVGSIGCVILAVVATTAVAQAQSVAARFERAATRLDPAASVTEPRRGALVAAARVVRSLASVRTATCRMSRVALVEALADAATPATDPTRIARAAFAIRAHDCTADTLPAAVRVAVWLGDHASVDRAAAGSADLAWATARAEARLIADIALDTAHTLLVDPPMNATHARVIAAALLGRPARRAALEELARSLDPTTADAGDAEARLGLELAVAREYDAAVARDEAARTTLAAALGADDPRVADAENLLAVALGQLGRIDEAIAANRRAFAIRSIALGERAPETLISLSNIAVMEDRAGHLDEARAAQLELIAARRALDPPAWEGLAVSLESVGRDSLRRGDAADAETRYREAAAARDGHLRADHPDLWRPHEGLARALLAQQRIADALPEATRAVDLARATSVRDVATPLATLEACLRAAGRSADADRVHGQLPAQ